MTPRLLGDQLKKRALTALAIGGALLAGAAFGTAAFADDGAITGDASAVLTFTGSQTVEVAVTATNTSSVPAYGWAVVYGPDDRTYNFSERRFEPGETWTWKTTVVGHPCADVDDTSTQAYASSTPGGPVEWTTGLVTPPDPRITVVGCGTTTTPTPTPTPTTPTPTPTPTTPTPTPTATTPTPTPTPTEPTPTPTTPTGSPTPTPSGSSTSTPVPSADSDDDLAATGMAIGTTLAAAVIGGGLILGGAALLRSRRS